MWSAYIGAAFLSDNKENLDESSDHHKEKEINNSKMDDEEVFCSIKPDEVPPVPDNKFLRRKVESREAGEKKAESEVANRDRRDDRVKEKSWVELLGCSKS